MIDISSRMASIVSNKVSYMCRDIVDAANPPAQQYNTIITIQFRIGRDLRTVSRSIVDDVLRKQDKEWMDSHT